MYNEVLGVLIHISQLITVAQSFRDVLQCSFLQEIFERWSIESKLREYQEIVNSYKADFTEVESEQEQGRLSPVAQLSVKKLKDSIYEAEDFLERVTLAEQQRQTDKNGNWRRKLRRMFSFPNPAGVIGTLCQRIKDIRARLDAILHETDNKSICSSEESSSVVHAPNIIAREGDVNKIVAMLQDSGEQPDEFFLPIVGETGSGKTAVAQLVINDPRIKKFPKRLWISMVAYDCEEHLDIKGILVKILESATEQKHQFISFDHLKRAVKEMLTRQKYLLVLDEAWNEDRDEWLKLVDCLIGGLMGSRILVTTRSRRTARVIGNGSTYELEGLSEKDSRRIFFRAAFGDQFRGAYPSDLVQIGHDIVKSCNNNPLYLRVMGSLLYGGDKEMWLSVRKSGIELERLGKGIKSRLKLSYDHLPSRLKKCLRFCLLIPKLMS